MAYKALNNAYSTLAASINTLAETLTVATGQGDRFPVITGSDFTYITLEDASANIEIVKVTARATSSDSMTIERAQDGTTARNWASGDIVELRLIAGLIEDAFDHINDPSAAHAASAISFDNTGTSLSATNEQAAIVELDTDRQANTASIASNTSDIATNESNIATNASNIATNTSNISSNASAIATNASNIATNASAITALDSAKLDVSAKASTAEAEAGSDDANYMTALKTKEAIDEQVPALFNATGLAPFFAIRAWGCVTISGGVPTLAAGGNVTSITDNGTGDFTVNFTTAMPDANYAVMGWVKYISSTKAGLLTGNSTSTKTVSALQVFTVNASSATGVDVDEFTFAIIR